MNSSERNRIIVRTGIVGILANVLLAGFKAAVGYLSNSIADAGDILERMRFFQS